MSALVVVWDSSCVPATELPLSPSFGIPRCAAAITALENGPS
jgi:hypothetical protein